MFDTTTEVALAATDVVVYAVLGYQVLRRRKDVSKVESAAQAFSVLEKELRRTVPTLPSGFTWKEAVGEAQKLGIAVDWPEVGKEVEAYEAYRYGGEREPVEFTGVLTLARELRGTK
jgi:hypothetical protein